MNPLRPVQHAIRSLAIAPVRLYQRFISPMMPPTCRYAPTCSNYAIEAVRIHGIIKGTILSLWRILRCNPWSHGGVDYVPPHGQWTPEPWVPPEDWVGHQSGESAIPMGLDPASGSTQPREYGVNSTATDLR